MNKNYYKSETWKRTREEMVEQSGGICEECGWPLDSTPPHTHHKCYKNLGHEDYDELAVLHMGCHRRKHRRRGGNRR
jgi:5-methylcytosine-specific restriction endonuclease McrA